MTLYDHYVYVYVYMQKQQPDLCIILQENGQIGVTRMSNFPIKEFSKK